MPTYYNPYTDQFIDNGDGTVTVKINQTDARIVQVTELSEESIERIADAIVRKLREGEDHESRLHI